MFQIARELRLRDIGGIIVVDFIDMADECKSSFFACADVDDSHMHILFAQPWDGLCIFQLDFVPVYGRHHNPSYSLV